MPHAFTRSPASRLIAGLAAVTLCAACASPALPSPALATPDPVAPTAVPTLTPTPSPTPAPSPTAPGDLAPVTRVIDGDTIKVMLNGQEVSLRYIGIDSPERGSPCSDQATAANQTLVGGQTVRLVKDVSETDRYGRLLRYVYASGDIFVNAELVKGGWARATEYPPDTAHAAEFEALQASARAQNVGCWPSGVFGGAALAPTLTAFPAQGSASPAATPANLPFTLLALTSPVAVGGQASLQIRVAPGALCHLSYITPAGTTSQAKGLGDKTAGADGICAWSWKIGSSTRPGTGHLRVTVAGVLSTLEIVIQP